MLRGVIFLFAFVLYAACSDRSAPRELSFHEMLDVAKGGDVEAQYKLGLIYFTGENDGVDFNEALKWFKKVEKNPISESYKNGENDKTIKYYARKHIGTIYALIDKEKDDIGYSNRNIDKNSFEYIKIAAYAGGLEAQYNMAVEYEGKYHLFDYGKEKNKINLEEELFMSEVGENGYTSQKAEMGKKAIYWMTKVAEQNDSRGFHNLGAYYAQGLGGNIDLKKALYYFSKSAEMGNKYGLYFMGMNYKDGDAEYGFSADQEKAYEYLERAASQGVSSAYGALYNMYLKMPGRYPLSVVSKTKSSDIEYRVNSCQVVDHLNVSSEVLKPNELEGTRFLVIDASIKNIGSKTVAPVVGELLVIDRENVYEYSKKERIYDQGYWANSEEINPLVTYKTKVVYRIPDELKGLILWRPDPNEKTIVTECAFVYPKEK